MAGPLSKSERPSVFLAMRPDHTFSVLTSALRLGIRIPKDISLVSRDTHPLFDLAMPGLTRYSSPATTIAKRAVNLAMNILAGRKIPLQPMLVTPTFVPGTTLARYRSASRRL
jgi:DNA-binding LacI/PurR family transcriptional regulator